MEIKKAPEDIGYDVAFEVDDVKVLKAVYLESINRQLQKGNSNLSEQELRIARLPSDKSYSRRYTEFGGLIEKLDEFIEYTDNEVKELTNVYPLHSNTDALDRRQLGHQAEVMREAIDDFLDDELVADAQNPPAGLLESGDLPPLPADIVVPDTPAGIKKKS